MMNYHLHPRIILRVPRFPVTYAGSRLQEMLQDPVFREAIYLASDSLYNELVKNDFDLNACSKKARHSLEKYHKRMCYRPTPFGTFAAVATVPISETGSEGIVLKSDSFKSLVSKRDKSSVIKSPDSYRLNPFIYPYGDDLRVINRSENSSQSTYSISEIFGSDLLKFLLSFRGSMGTGCLNNLIAQHFLDISEQHEYIGQLKGLQVILPVHPPGPDFPLTLSQENASMPGSSYNSHCSVHAAGSLPAGVQQQIRRGIYCLEKMSRRKESNAFTEFKVRFEKLFDRREVPLLQALDPEMGVDYDGLSTDTATDLNHNGASGSSWSALHKLLLRKWTNQRENGIAELKLTEEDLAGLENQNKHYPPGMSVLFNVVGDKLHIKAAGGASSLNMIGRFTTLDPEILDLAKELAVREMQQNPEVVFAEITHIDSAQVASVNQKVPLYDYEIPFFETPLLDDEFVIGLNDLYISLSDQRLVLGSARLNKQVVPRYSNAYNYHRSTLPIFRFLCDLQHESVDSNLNFNMSALFPGLPAYPRITFKDVIIEAASWHLDAKELRSFWSDDPEQLFKMFTNYADNIGLPGEFAYEVHDHLLHIDRSVQKDIVLLLQALPASGKVIFREYFSGQESLVKDDQGNCYTHEGLAFLINREATYKKLRRLPALASAGKSKMLPFDGWLYFKIYMNPAGYPDLLLNFIEPFIKMNREQGTISSWFFISYYDDDYHLRVRLKQVNGQEHSLLEAYKKLEGQLRQLPNLRRLELATYFPEYERYSSIGICKAENLFSLSSEIVLAHLHNLKSADQAEYTKLVAGLKHLWLLFLSLHFSFIEIEKQCSNMIGKMSKAERIKLDIEFREHQQPIHEGLKEDCPEIPASKDYFDLLTLEVANLPSDEKLRVVIDLNHMHLNRLYLQNQIAMEQKTYYFLAKISGRYKALHKESNFSIVRV